MVGYKVSTKKKKKAQNMVNSNNRSKLLEQIGFHTGQCINTIDASSDVSHLEKCGVCPSNYRKLTWRTDAE